MNFPGFKVDTDALAEGLLRMIKEHPDGACIIYGMFPAEIMEAFDKAVDKKIPDAYLVRDTGEVIEHGKYYKEQIIHEVSCKILQLATERGICVV